MNKPIKPIILIILLLALLITACVKKDSPPASELIPETDTEEMLEEPVELVVMTHDSFSVSEEVVRAFEEENNAVVTFVKSGDTGSALNRAILSKDAPLADVFYGVDNTFLSRALSEDIFESYDSPLLDDIDASFKLDPENGALPVDYGDVCINYEKAYFEANDIPVPTSLDDLLKDTYREMLVVENPATSSPGLAFLMATIAKYGEEGYLNYWTALRDNGVLVVNDWESAYYSSFSMYAGEESGRPMVVSYATSPAAEVIFASEPLDESPTASLIAPGTCFRQIEFVGILKGTENRDLAEKWVDFMLSETFQSDIPNQMFVYPVNGTVALPEAFELHGDIAEEPAVLDPALITENREEWIQAWDETVLR